MKAMETTEEVSSHPGKTGIGDKKGIATRPLPEKSGGPTGKRLANLWSRRKITKKAHAGRGPEIKGGIAD
jgi:hypothetical protein